MDSPGGTGNPRGAGCAGHDLPRGRPTGPAALRSLLVKAVKVVGAGSGGVGAGTMAGLESVRQCDVCLYDALMDHDLLGELPGGARAIDVGKRAGDHAKEQREINLLLADLARKGRRVCPDPDVLAMIQDKGRQKQFFLRQAIPTPAFMLYEERDQILRAVDQGRLAILFVQKARTAGYDGKDVVVVRVREDLA